MGKEIAFRMAKFPTFKGSWPWPWIGLYCIPSCISHRPLPTYQISLKSKKRFLTATYCQRQSHMTQKVVKNQKSGPNILSVLPLNLRIRGHLPALIINGGGDSRWKWPNFRFSGVRDLDLDVWSGHAAYYHASLVDLYLNIKFRWNRRNLFGRTDGRTDVRTGRRTFETHFISSTRRSRLNYKSLNRSRPSTLSTNFG